MLVHKKWDAVQMFEKLLQTSNAKKCTSFLIQMVLLLLLLLLLALGCVHFNWNVSQGCTDEGVISPVIQPKNSNRGTSSAVDPELLCIPRSKMQDPKLNIRWRRRAEFSRRVPSQWCACLQTSLWQQTDVAMMKHEHRAINLANEMSILLDVIDEHGAESSALQWSWVSHLCKITSALLAKHQNRKLCFNVLSLLFSSLVWVRSILLWRITVSSVTTSWDQQNEVSHGIEVMCTFVWFSLWHASQVRFHWFPERNSMAKIDRRDKQWFFEHRLIATQIIVLVKFILLKKYTWTFWNFCFAVSSVRNQLGVFTWAFVVVPFWRVCFVIWFDLSCSWHVRTMSPNDVNCC